MNAPRLCDILAVLILSAMFHHTSHAEWSSDPLQNLAVADRTGEQVQPKIRVTSDNGCYISWFDNAGGGYDVYLQRLDAQGNEVWMHNGLLIADRGFSSTQDYGLAVDAADNALLTFRDDRFTDIQITAVKVSPQGLTLWGPNGIQLTSDTLFKAAPKIAATTDGSVVVAWTNDNDVKLQKLSSGGTPLWGSGVILAGSADFLLSDLNASGSGQVIVSWIRTVDFSSPKHLYAQKVSPLGGEVWPARAIVFDGGSLQFGNFPPFVPDGAGGAVFAWYGVSPLQCYVQRILADGSEQFAHNGVAASTLGTQFRVSPSVSYDPDTENIFLFWPEINSLQSMFGIYGQRFGADGTRLWGDAGQVLVPLDATERTQVRNAQLGDGAVALWVETLGFGDQRILAARLDGNGDFVWTPTMIEPSSVASGKSRLAVAQTAAGVALLAWQDGRNDADDIYAQNLNTDGSLGLAPCPADLDGDGAVGSADLALLLGAWGPNPGHAADLDGDGTVGSADLALLLGAWGPC